MTEEELEKATGQELIDQRDYCGVDGYYGNYLDDVNAEMLKRFNHLVELEKENAELKAQIEKMKCCMNCKYFDPNEPRYCDKCVFNAYVCNKWELAD